MPITLAGSTGITTPGMESTAMPTVGGDAVVESGSNTDGEWTKFADGTQRCLKRAAASLNANTAEGSIFRASAQGTWTFPVVFIARPVVDASPASRASPRWCAPNSTEGTDTAEVDLNMFAGTQSAVGISVDAVAHGRWK